MKKTPGKVQHLWTIICKDSTVDAETNNVSLNRVLEDLHIEKAVTLDKLGTAKGGETVPFGFHVVSLWKREDADKSKEVVAEGAISVIDPSGQSLLEVPYHIRIEPGKARFRSIVRFNAIKITTQGEYVFRIVIKDDRGNVTHSVDAYLTVHLKVSVKKK